MIGRGDWGDGDEALLTDITPPVGENTRGDDLASEELRDGTTIAAGEKLRALAASDSLGIDDSSGVLEVTFLKVASDGVELIADGSTFATRCSVGLDDCQIRFVLSLEDDLVCLVGESDGAEDARLTAGLALCVRVCSVAIGVISLV